MHPILLKQYGQPLIEGSSVLDRQALASLEARKQALEAVREKVSARAFARACVRICVRCVGWAFICGE